MTNPNDLRAVAERRIKEHFQPCNCSSCRVSRAYLAQADRLERLETALRDARALSIYCNACHAEPGDRCYKIDGSGPDDQIHTERYTDALARLDEGVGE